MTHKLLSVILLALPLAAIGCSAAPASEDPAASDEDALSKSDACVTPARKQAATWSNPKSSTCTAVDAYEITVKGEPTYALTCAVAHDSIRVHIAIYDGAGADIEQAAVYHSNDVGTNGVSWQNETFLQQ